MKKVIVFSAEWCSNCGPHKERLTQQGVEFTEIDVDTDAGSATASKYNVRSLPTTIIVDNSGQLLNKYVGTGRVSDVKRDLNLGK